MNLAANIKAVARKYGMTITQIAEAQGVMQSQLSRTINNPRISLVDLEKIAEIIGCQVGDFFANEPSQQLTCPHCGKPLKVEIR